MLTTVNIDYVLFYYLGLKCKSWIACFIWNCNPFPTCLDIRKMDFNTPLKINCCEMSNCREIVITHFSLKVAVNQINQHLEIHLLWLNQSFQKSINLLYLLNSSFTSSRHVRNDPNSTNLLATVNGWNSAHVSIIVHYNALFQLRASIAHYN